MHFQVQQKQDQEALRNSEKHLLQVQIYSETNRAQPLSRVHLCHCTSLGLTANSNTLATFLVQCVRARPFVPLNPPRTHCPNLTKRMALPGQKRLFESACRPVHLQWQQCERRRDLGRTSYLDLLPKGPRSRSRKDPNIYVNVSRSSSGMRPSPRCHLGTLDRPVRYLRG